MSPPGKSVPSDRTMLVATGVRAAREYRPYVFKNLEKVSKAQQLLTHKLEWLLPAAGAVGKVSDGVRTRLKDLFEEDIRLVVDYVHVVPPKTLRKYIGEPTFLGVLAPSPHKSRGFLEVDLSLAHMAIDKLLGGAGEMVSLRPLTDIEEGVMTYVLIEVLKALAPGLEPGLPRLRLEGLAQSFEDLVPLFADEQMMVVVQLKVVLGSHTGFLRMFLPASVVAMVEPPEGPERRSRRAAETVAHLGRLSGLKTWLRAEIGWAEIGIADLQSLRERDVVLMERVTARPDRKEGGKAQLRLGAGKRGHFDADVVVKDGRYHAKLTAFQPGEPVQDMLDELSQVGAVEGAAPDTASDDESTSPQVEQTRRPVDESTLKSGEGAQLLNDIPLQIAVELARVPVTAEQVVALKVGHVIDLNRVPGEPVELSVNSRVVARGELVEVDGHLGVRVLSLQG